MKKDCRVCGHLKSEHQIYIGPNWIDKKVKHVSCVVIIKRTEVDLSDIGISSIGHRCSCDGFKPNTSLKRAIKKYTKALKERDFSEYKIKEVKDVIRRFRKDIRDNPKNLLHWQLEQENQIVVSNT